MSHPAPKQWGPQVTDDRPAAPLSRELYERGERTEREVDAFISRRHMQCVRERVRTGGERAEGVAGVESERRHTAARRAANRSARLRVPRRAGSTAPRGLPRRLRRLPRGGGVDGRSADRSGMKTVREIRAEPGRNAAEIVNAYPDAIDEIEARRQLDTGVSRTGSPASRRWSYPASGRPRRSRGGPRAGASRLRGRGGAATGPGAANAPGGGDGVSAEPCKACGHQERNVVDRAFGAGQAPRPVVRRYAGLNRKALTRHRDVRLVATSVAKAGMLSARSTRRKA